MESPLLFCIRPFMNSTKLATIALPVSTVELSHVYDSDWTHGLKAVLRTSFLPNTVDRTPLIDLSSPSSQCGITPSVTKCGHSVFELIEYTILISGEPFHAAKQPPQP